MKDQFYNGILEKVSGFSSRWKIRVQIDINNLNKWRISAASQMLKKLNDEAAESDYRYRYIDKPSPLL